MLGRGERNGTSIAPPALGPSKRELLTAALFHVGGGGTSAGVKSPGNYTVSPQVPHGA